MAVTNTAQILMKAPVFDPNWSAETKALYRHDVQEIWNRSIAPHIWNQYHNQLNVYVSLVDSMSNGTPKKILDVGCAQGTLALILAEQGHSVLATDLRQSFLDYAKSRYSHGDIRFLTANALDMEIDERFDVIFANQIIEHLVYPKELVRRLKLLLSSGGILVITTPNWHYIKNDLPSFSEIGDPADHAARQFSSDADGHFFAYRDDELTEVFRSQGFGSVNVRYFETPFISGHMKVRYCHRLVPVAILRALDTLLLNTSLARSAAHQLMVIGRT